MTACINVLLRNLAPYLKSVTHIKIQIELGDLVPQLGSTVMNTITIEEPL
jgi:hypothetical protein